MDLMKQSSIVGLVMLVGSLALPGQGRGQPPPEIPAGPPGIIGLPMAAVEHIPGVARLFASPNASDPPVIIRGEPFRPGEVVARFRLELSDDEVLQLARRAGALRVVRKSPLGLFVLHGPQSQKATEQVMHRIWETGKTVTVSPNYTGGGLTFMPNDPHSVSGAQWYLDAPSDIDLDLPDAWDVTRGSPGVVVGVMDTGILTAHPEFVGRLWVNPGEIPGNDNDDDGNGYVDDINGWDTTSIPTNPNGDPDINDDDGGSGGGGIGHGTWVSSILLANTDNAHQVAGFDHFAKLLTVRSFNQSSGINLDHVLGGLDYLLIMSQHYDVLNMSWVAPSTISAIEILLDSFEQAGVLMIAGAGNGSGSTEVWYPASHPVAVTIGATDDTDTRAPFSDTGPSLDFVAPGVDIYTASFDDPFSSTAFHVGPGTSFSTPMVTGIASLGFAIRPAMTKDELVDALKASAVDLGAPGWDPEYGWGRVNAHEALQVLESLLFFDDFETGDLSRWDSSSP